MATPQETLKDLTPKDIEVYKYIIEIFYYTIIIIGAIIIIWLKTNINPAYKILYTILSIGGYYNLIKNYIWTKWIIITNSDNQKKRKK